MMNNFPPGFIMIIGALLIPFLPHIIRQIYMLVLILTSAYALKLGFGIHTKITLMDFEFILFQSDPLTLPFAIIFHVAAVLNVIYGAHVKLWNQHIAIISYSVGQLLLQFMLVTFLLYLCGGRQQQLLQCF